MAEWKTALKKLKSTEQVRKDHIRSGIHRAFTCVHYRDNLIGSTDIKAWGLLNEGIFILRL